MSRRSISKIFRKGDEPGEVLEFILDKLPTNDQPSSNLTQKICITINLDPDKRGSMIPEGPKEPRSAHGKGKQR